MLYLPEYIDFCLRNFGQLQAGSWPTREERIASGSPSFESCPPSRTAEVVADLELAIASLPGRDQDCVWAFIVAGGNINEARHNLRRDWGDVRDAVDRSLVAMAVTLGTPYAMADDSLQNLLQRRREIRRRNAQAARIEAVASTSGAGA